MKLEVIYILRFGFFFPCSTFQAFIQCYFAERIKKFVFVLKIICYQLFLKFSSTSKIAEAAYETNWYDASVKVRKMILMIITRSQEGEKIIALKIIKVDLETFKWVRVKIFMIFYKFLLFRSLSVLTTITPFYKLYSTNLFKYS